MLLEVHLSLFQRVNDRKHGAQVTVIHYMLFAVYTEIHVAPGNVNGDSKLYD